MKTATAGPRPEIRARMIPLVVDLDDTLVRTDTLLEQYLALFFRRPLAALLLLALLVSGRARFKVRLAELQPVDAAVLPYREELVSYLQRAKAAGRALHLVSAADLATTQAVALHLGLFDTVEGSDGRLNLKGRFKAERLAARFPDGFAYAGDSAADLKVWVKASAVILAGASRNVAARVRATGTPVEAEFTNGRTSVVTWLRALRVHQWLKNTLVFVPLFLSHQFVEARSVALSLAAFVSLGLVASATYLINDLADLSADRRHRTKRRRPLAAGDLPIVHGVLAAAGLLVAGGSLALAISPGLYAGLAAYTLLTLAYTFGLKRQALLDVVALGALYGIRLIIGTVAIDAPYSIWLLTFSMFFFFSLALAKRQAEITGLETLDQSRALTGRGYRVADGPAVLALGVASAMASVLIVVLYLVEEAFPSNGYARPDWLWTAPFVLLVWISRIWLIAGRGELDEDPIAFAIKDSFSWLLAFPLALAFALATFQWW